MRSRSINRLRKACSRAITLAIVRCAQVRPTLQNFTRDLQFSLPGIIATLLSRSTWIVRDAAGLHPYCIMLRLIPVRSPLPDVSNHVVEPITVRRKRPDGRGALIAIAAQIVPWKFTLPRIRHVASVRKKFLPPCKSSAVQSTPCCKLPLRLRRQIFSRPFRISLPIAISDMKRRDATPALLVNSQDQMGEPVRAAQEFPPVVEVHIDALLRLNKHRRTGVQHLR